MRRTTHPGPSPSSFLACVFATVEVKGTAVDFDYEPSIRPAEISFFSGDSSVQARQRPAGRAQNLQGHDFGAATRSFQGQARVARDHFGKSADAAAAPVVTEAISKLVQRGVLETHGLADSAGQGLLADRPG
jgi:hypothetical protein